MHVEVYRYGCMREGISMEDIKRRMPDELRASLLSDYGVQVLASQNDAVARLDKYFRIGRACTFYRSFYVEVDKRDIERYSHFYISLPELEINESVFFEMVRPTCGHKTCPWGAQIVPPIEITPAALQRLRIAEISRPWKLVNELVLSQSFKELLEGEGVKGLCFERGGCSNSIDGARAVAYLAAVETTTWQRARTEVDLRALIDRQQHCEQHHTDVAGAWLGDGISEEAVGDHDIQTVNRARVGGVEVYFQPPQLIVSKRLLRILLREKLRGMATMTSFVKEKFRPILVNRAL